MEIDHEIVIKQLELMTETMERALDCIKQLRERCIFIELEVEALKIKVESME